MADRRQISIFLNALIHKNYIRMKLIYLDKIGTCQHHENIESVQKYIANKHTYL